MLINFSVQNFGSIKEKQTLSFEANKSQHLEEYYVIETNDLRLLKLALIYGANASGKTTILKALNFLRTLILNPKNQKTEIFRFEPFLFDENTPQQNTIFEIEFIQNDVRYLYEVELNKKAIVREDLFAHNSKKSNVFNRTTDSKNEVTKIKFGSKIKVSKSAEETLENNTLWNNTVLGGFLKTNIELKELKDTMDWFRDYLSISLNHNYIEEGIFDANKKSILDIIRKADFNISNILITPRTINEFSFAQDSEARKAVEEWVELQNSLGNKNIEFEHSVNNKNYLLDFSNESKGTQEYYRMAGILFMLIKYPKALSIDELESSLHPDLFQHFLLSFLVNSKESQIIATTHNREILNNKDIFRNDAIWITDKDNKDCATELYSLADFDTSVIRDTTNVLNAFKLGKLGGVPNLGSYYININDENK
jgi:AAA15 family ATPase/GTPase